MTAPAVAQPSSEQIKANLASLREQGAPDDVIDRYMASVGAKPASGPDFSDVQAGSSSSAVPQVGHAEGVGRQLGQGLSGGLSDELEGMQAAGGGMDPVGLGMGLAAALRGDPRYTGARDNARARQHEYSREHPVIAGAAEFAGGIPTAVAIPGGSALRAGAALGGLSAFGHGEGSAGKQAKQTAIGGALGGAVGKGMELAGRPLRNIGSALLTRLNLRPTESVGPVEGTKDIARRFVRKQFERDAITEAGQMPQAVGPAGGHPDEVVADAGGTMVKRALAGLQKLPGKGANAIKTALQGRQAGQFGRITDDLQTIMRVPAGDADRVASDLVSSKYAASKPLYDKAYAHGAVDDTEINKLLTAPETAPWMRRAFDKARQIADLEGQPLPQIYKTTMQASRVMDANGNAVMVPVDELVEVPDVRTLDYMKRELDSIIKRGQANMGEGGLSSTEAHALRTHLRDRLVHRLDQLVPDYGAARSQFTTATSAEEALANGLNIFRQQSRLPADDVANMSAADREMYLVGAFRAIRDRLARSNDQADITKILNNPDVREQLASVARQPGEFETIMQTLQRETNMAETAAGLGNSSTPTIGAMQAEIENVSPDVFTSLGSFATMHPIRGTAQLARSLFTRQGTHPAGGVAEQAGEMLMQPATPGNLQDIFRPDPVTQPLVSRLGSEAAGRLMAPQLSDNAMQGQAEAVQLRSAGLSNQALEAELAKRYTPALVKFLVAATPARIPQNPQAAPAQQGMVPMQ